MATKTLTNSLPSVNRRSYFIVFVNDTGKILSIKTSKTTNTKSGTTQVETKNPICRSITKGTARMTQYGMVWDIMNSKWDIGVRSTKLIIESTDNKLIPFVKNAFPGNTEIFARIYYDSKKIEVESNRSNIASIKNLSDITEIANFDTKLLDIYITKKTRP